MVHILQRILPPASLKAALIAGLGAGLGIGLLGGLTDLSGFVVIMAPFGASCVLLFAAPAAPLSQPANVIFGHAVSALVGLALNAVLPDVWWAVALAVGLAISAMVFLRVTHPPAGANPLVVFAVDPSWSFLVSPVIPGAVLLVALAVAYHKLISGLPYPVLPAPEADG